MGQPAMGGDVCTAQFGVGVGEGVRQAGPHGVFVGAGVTLGTIGVCVAVSKLGVADAVNVDEGVGVGGAGVLVGTGVGDAVPW